MGGSFLEAQRVQHKQPVEIAASKEAVSALLDYIYDGQPEVPVEVALEVMRLAEAYDLPKLAGDIEAGILACLDSSVALQVLQEAHGLHSLRDACEDKVAEEFETCSEHPEAWCKSAGQNFEKGRSGCLTGRNRSERNIYLEQSLQGRACFSHAAATCAISSTFDREFASP